MEKEIKPLSAWEKFQAYLVAAIVAKQNKAEIKFNQTHKLVGRIPAPYMNDEKRIRKGKPTLLLPQHTRAVRNPETKEIVRVPVEIDCYQFTGWDYGKKYTGEKLRELRKERNAA